MNQAAQAEKALPANQSAETPAERGRKIGEHLKKCFDCVVVAETGAVVSACKEGRELLWGSLDVDTTHAKVEGPVAKALREELRAQLGEPLTVSRLRRLGRLVTASISDPGGAT